MRLYTISERSVTPSEFAATIGVVPIATNIVSKARTEYAVLTTPLELVVRGSPSVTAVDDAVLGTLCNGILRFSRDTWLQCVS